MIDEVLLGKTRAGVLRETYLNTDRRISFNELVRRTGTGAGAVSREVATLLDAGLIVEAREGNQRFIAASSRSPVFAELKALIVKTSGAQALVREALEGLGSKIQLAVIIGSVAKGTEHADSDLDLFVVGSAGYSLLAERMRDVQERLGRPVQILYFDINSKTDRTSLLKPSTRALLTKAKVFVFGDEERLKSVLKEDPENGTEEKPGRAGRNEATGRSRRRTQLGHAKRAR